MGRVHAGLERATVESRLALDVRIWYRAKLLGSGQTFPWEWRSARGELIAGVTVTVAADMVVLAFEWRVRGTSEWQPGSQCVPIVWTALHPLSPHCRGDRPFFLCPQAGADGKPCGKRVAKLYPSHDSPHFACRRCRRLAWAVEQEGPRARAIRRAQKARLRLGGVNLFALLPRPRGMWRTTYARLLGQVREADERCWGAQLTHLLGRSDRMPRHRTPDRNR